MKHVFECHSSTPNFRFSCGISGCVQTFKTYSAYSSHLKRKHENCDFTQLQSVSTGSSQFADDQEDLGEEGSEEHQTKQSGLAIRPAQRSSALLLLSLKEKYRLTQTAVDFTVGQVKELLVHALEEVKSSVQMHVGEIDVDIDECFEFDPFEGLSSEFLHRKFYRENFNLVVRLLVFVLIMSVYNLKFNRSLSP